MTQCTDGKKITINKKTEGHCKGGAGKKENK